MHLRKLAKDADSGTNGCPTVYAIDELPEYLVIQGVQADVESSPDSKTCFQARPPSSSSARW